MKRRESRAPGPNPGLANRDMQRSAFAPILDELITRIPGALGAALVDREGEAVDYAGCASAFDIRVCAAHWKIVLNEIEASATIGAPRSLVVRCEKRSFLAHALPEGYAVVLLIRRRGGFAPSPRALSVCESALRVEAGWSSSSPNRPWFCVAVSCDARSRPAKIRARTDVGLDVPIEIVGRLVGLSRAERGYRARLPNGAELTLVREPGGTWYSDEDINAAPKERGA